MLLLAHARWGATLAAITTVTLASRATLAADPPAALDLGDGVRLELVLIRAGSFMQGSPPQEPGRNPDETARQVTLSRDYHLGKYPVTRGQFSRFVTESGYRTEAERGTSGGSGWDGNGLTQGKEFTWRTPGFEQTADHPVVLVTFDDAVAFTEWLSKKSGREVALPTEAQWEYAARAGSRTRFYGGDGDDIAGRIGWFNANAGDGTRPVGQKQANEWGLHDMAGNAWQWCRDFYGPYPAGPATDPLQTASPSGEDKPRRVLRGGSWLKDARNLRSAARSRNTPGSRNADNGFRVVAALDASLQAAAPSSTAPSSTAPAPGESVDDLPRVSPTAGATGLGAGACIGVLALGTLILALFVGLRKKGPAPDGGGHGVSWKLAADGFFLLAPGHLRGARVFYRVVSHGRAVPGTTVLDGSPNGQFIYTGSPPLRIAVDRVEQPGGQAKQSRHEAPFAPGGGHSGGPHDQHGYQAQSLLQHQSSEPEEAEEPDEPFDGFPSAY